MMMNKLLGLGIIGTVLYVAFWTIVLWLFLEPALQFVAAITHVVQSIGDNIAKGTP